MTKAAELAKFIADGTLGTGVAEDKKIAFDGNAQDFHIGLDDSTDKLTVGKGTALGTTTSMTFDADGQVTKPLQCAFNVKNSSNQSDIAVASYVRVTLGSEHYDIGGNFASNTFTAPVTGKYQLNVNVRIDAVANNSTYYLCYLTTSNQGYYQTLDSDAVSLSYFCFVISVVADMDANDTAYIDIYQAGGTQQTDIVGTGGDPVTHFSGYLLG